MSGYGYSLLTKNGERNTRKYIASLDYSLDQIKLADAYWKFYRRKDFSFKAGHKSFSSTVMVVTFKYAVCDFNRMPSDTFVRFGYDGRTMKFSDCSCVVDGELVGIVLGQEVREPLPQSILGKYFAVEDGKYKLVNQPKKLKSPTELREELYRDGFQCGGVHYCRWKRSAGSARVGKVMFIDANLFPAMHRWEMCGLNIKTGDEIDLAALESYISLTTSSIIDTIEIDPQNILIIDDFNSVFKTNAVSVEEEDGRLVASQKEVEVSNCIWDGQGLIDVSAMGCYSDKGMVLLRNQFFKCCCFNANLQQWFSDNDITEVSQLNGKTNAQRIEDIKLVTTPSSIKYLKFGSLQAWRDHISSSFGVVKHDKKTHFFGGRMVQTHYQLLNTLQMSQEDVREFLEPTLSYLKLLRTNPAVVRNHIKYPIDSVDVGCIGHSVSKNDVVYRMLGLNEKFCRTRLYADFVKDLVKSQVKSLRLGHVLVNGNYSTLVGNPYEMLLATIGQFDGTTSQPKGTVHSTRFEYGVRLCGSRSPHITMSNVWTPVNVRHERLDRYLNLTPEIVCINSIGENTLNRLSGSDFDSDTVLLTDNQILVNAALRNDGVFPVAVDNVQANKIKRAYCPEQQAELDNKTSNNLIGDIINCSQELNTLIWSLMSEGKTLDGVMDVYLDVCKLNAAQTIEIDSAKREFNINNAKELSMLRSKYLRLDDKERKIKPAFFAAKDKGKGYYNPAAKNYAYHDTTMDYLQRTVNSWQNQVGRELKKTPFLPFSDLLTAKDFHSSHVSNAKVNMVLDMIRQEVSDENDIYNMDLEDSMKYRLVSERRQECVETIGEMRFGTSTMIALLHSLDEDDNHLIRRRMFHILFGYPNASFYSLIEKCRSPIRFITENSDGDLMIYGIPYTESQQKIS